MHSVTVTKPALAFVLQVLVERQEVLLLKGCIDLDSRTATSWPVHYVARPASNACSMLLRRCDLSAVPSEDKRHEAVYVLCKETLRVL